MLTDDSIEKVSEAISSLSFLLLLRIPNA